MSWLASPLHWFARALAQPLAQGLCRGLPVHSIHSERRAVLSTAAHLGFVRQTKSN
ncbi:MAG TPA: hypothetical protein VGQ40_04655 [Chthoniobacterales bacterium]|nr:hypothetical protein [Chthoniobacterales bacterium]